MFDVFRTIVIIVVDFFFFVIFFVSRCPTITLFLLYYLKMLKKMKKTRLATTGGSEGDANCTTVGSVQVVVLLQQPVLCLFL